MSDMEVTITVKNADANLPILIAAEDMRDHITDIFRDQVEDPVVVIVKIVTEIPISHKGKQIIKRCLYSIDTITEDSIDEIREEKE